MSNIKVLMASDGGKFARYQTRRGKRVRIHIDGIEPMSAPDRMAFGEEVVAAFKGISRTACLEQAVVRATADERRMSVGGHRLLS